MPQIDLRTRMNNPSYMRERSVILAMLVIGIVIGGLGAIALIPRSLENEGMRSGVALSDVWYDCIPDGTNVVQTLRFNLTSYEPHLLNITVKYEGWVGETLQILQPLERREIVVTQRYPGPCLVLGAHIVQ